MCMLLKFAYAKFGVSNELIFFKSYRRKAFGEVGSKPPVPFKGRVNIHIKTVHWPQLSPAEVALLN